MDSCSLSWPNTESFPLLSKAPPRWARVSDYLYTEFSPVVQKEVKREEKLLDQKLTAAAEKEQRVRGGPEVQVQPQVEAKAAAKSEAPPPEKRRRPKKRVKTLFEEY